MTVLSFQVGQAGLGGVFPSMIFVETNDTLSEVLAVGYLDHMFAENVPLQNGMMALVSTKPTTNSPVVNTYWLEVAFASGHWSLIQDTNVIVARTANIGGAGAGPLTISVPGMTSSSVVIATISTSSNTVAVAKAAAGSGSFALTLTSDPGATLTVNYIAYLVP